MAEGSKFSKKDYLLMPLEDAIKLKGLDVPLYIYLPKNKRLVLVFHSNLDIDALQLEKYKRLGLSGFFVPVDAKKELESIVELKEIEDEDFCVLKETGEVVENSVNIFAADVLQKSDKEPASDQLKVDKYDDGAVNTGEDTTSDQLQEDQNDNDAVSANEDEALIVRNDEPEEKVEHNEKMDVENNDEEIINLENEKSIEAKKELNARENNIEKPEIEIELKQKLGEDGAEQFNAKEKRNSNEEQKLDSSDDMRGNITDGIIVEQTSDIADNISNDLFNNNIKDSAEAIIEVLDSEDLTEAEKSEVLKAVGSRVLGELISISSGEKEESEAALKRCQKFSEAIINEVTKDHLLNNIFNEILRTHKINMGRSATVSAFAVMFSMCLGFSSKKLLADISFGALLHDIGFTRIGVDLFSIPEKNYSTLQQAEFETHVQKGLELLDENHVELTTIVKEIVSQHHELFDGSGYPNGL